jgi:hypothetical protein
MTAPCIGYELFVMFDVIVDMAAPRWAPLDSPTDIRSFGATQRPTLNGARGRL